MDIQVIDTNTCNPLPNIYMDIWHCNATVSFSHHPFIPALCLLIEPRPLTPALQGVYSGVQASGNGDESDATNLDATFLRGIQPSNKEGIVQFESIFPGHYTGRATHIHGTFTLTKPINQASRNTILTLLQSHHPRRKRNRSPGKQHTQWPLHRALLARRPTLLRPRPHLNRRKDLPLQHQHPGSHDQRGRQYPR